MSHYDARGQAGDDDLSPAGFAGGQGRTGLEVERAAEGNLVLAILAVIIVVLALLLG